MRLKATLCAAAAGAVVISAQLSSAQGVAKPPIQVRETQKVPANEVAPPATTTAAPATQADDARNSRASQVIGTDLVLESGDTLGKVNDLIIDNSSGTVAYVIVETDQDYRPIPWKALAMAQGQQATDQYFVIGMDRDRFMQSPVITQTQYQTFGTPQWHSSWSTMGPNVNRYYANVRVANPATVKRSVNTTNRDVNQADRALNKGERKAERKINN